MSRYHLVLEALRRTRRVPEKSRRARRVLRVPTTATPRLRPRTLRRHAGDPRVAVVVSSLDGAVRIAGALLARPLRKQRTTWGATPAEIAATYPGDELVPQPKWGYTHAVDVAAPPEQIWPWLVQIGQGRGGFYSYEGLENLVGCKIRNTTQILPEYGSADGRRRGEASCEGPRPARRGGRTGQSRWSLFGGTDQSPEKSLWAFHIVDSGGRTQSPHRTRTLRIRFEARWPDQLRSDTAGTHLVRDEPEDVADHRRSGRRHPAGLIDGSGVLRVIAPADANG